MKRRSLTLMPVLALAACVVVPPANPYPQAPPLRAEFIPPPPRERVVWQPGHWQWIGNGYSWLPGRYVEQFGRRWEAAHWRWDGRRWDWVPGRWI